MVNIPIHARRTKAVNMVTHTYMYRPYLRPYIPTARRSYCCLSYCVCAKLVGLMLIKKSNRSYCKITHTYIYIYIYGCMNLT